MQQLSQEGTVVAIKAKRFDQASRMLPSTVKNAIECPPLSDVLRVTDRDSVAAYIEFELVNMALRINVGGNLTTPQIQFLAQQLIDLYPGESLADFKICLERGAMGLYGDIYRMDGIVLRKWMAAYLEEKYQAIEDKLMSEKDDPFKHVEGRKAPPFDLIAEFRKVHGYDLEPAQKVPPMTREQILATGQSDPPQKRSTGAVPMTEEELAAWYRGKYPTATEEQIKTLIYTGKLC